MFEALDMRTELIVGALVCFTLAGIMVYYSLARKTYKGFHQWTLGFINVGVGAVLLTSRGVFPDFISIIIANLLVLAMPVMLTRGLATFLNIQWDSFLFEIILFVLFLASFVWGTYFTLSLTIRIVSFSAMFAIFFMQTFYIAYKYIPEHLGGQNWLLLFMITLCIITTILRLIVTLYKGASNSFLVSPDHLQSITVLMTILCVVGIMNSLIILNTHRMENELRTANKRIEEQSYLDGLTSLYNRGYFDKQLLEEFKRGQRLSKPISLIMADIDSFKNFNDTYGHQAGDDCIKAVADAFKKCGGRSTDIAARYGGEELVMILPNTNSTGAQQVARTIKNIVDGLEIPHRSSSASEYVTLSFGVATIIPDVNSTPETLIALADKALYRSKELGKNQITVSER